MGPSANLANSSMMSESMSESVTDGSVTMTTSNNYIQEQRPVTATIVRSSREPSISRIELARERSIPRTVNIIPSSTIKVVIRQIYTYSVVSVKGAPSTPFLGFFKINSSPTLITYCTDSTII